MGAAQVMTATGTVDELRQDELVLDRAEGPDLRLRVDPDTPVMRAGQPASLADLAVGAPVRVEYRLEANQPVVERIHEAQTTRQGRRAPSR
jgi:hypothetical protein